MTHSLVHTESPQERNYAKYLSKIERQKDQAADLKTEMEGLKSDLGRFSAEYHARVGALFIELDRLQLEIDEYRLRLGRMRAESDVDPEDLERQVRHGFSEKRKQIHEDEEETHAHEQIYRKDRGGPTLDKESESTQKSLFRESAKRFHPDLAKTENERQHRESVMKQVNTALHERDTDTLRTLSRKHDIIDPNFESKSIGEKLVWAIRELSRLDELIESLIAERVTLESSEPGLLWRRHQSEEDILQRLEIERRGRIDQERRYLQSFIEHFRLLIESRYA